MGTEREESEIDVKKKRQGLTSFSSFLFLPEATDDLLPVTVSGGRRGELAPDVSGDTARDVFLTRAAVEAGVVVLGCDFESLRGNCM